MELGEENGESQNKREESCHLAPAPSLLSPIPFPFIAHPLPPTNNEHVSSPNLKRILGVQTHTVHKNIEFLMLQWTN